MNTQPKWITSMLVALAVAGLAAGCDHQPRTSTGHSVPRTLRVANDSGTVEKLSSNPSIVRESVDARCFGPSQEDNTQVIACPRMMRLSTAAQ